jgi:hypothetical protein
MKRKIVYMICIALFLPFSGAINGQSGEAIVKDDVIKVRLRHPQKPSNRYFDNNKPKKKIKTRAKRVAGFENRSFVIFESNAKQDREKMIKKRRKKL